MTDLAALITKGMTEEDLARLADPIASYGPGTKAWSRTATQLARRVHHLIFFRTEASLTLDHKKAAKARREIDRGLVHLQRALKLMIED